MIYKNVLVPYDKSVHAKHALETALKLVADDAQAVLNVLYVVEASEQHDAAFDMAVRMAGVQSVDRSSNDMEHAFRDRRKQEIEESIAPLLEGCPNKVLVKVATGRPHHAILNYAYDHECDLIVMGCRGLNALQGMLGSVSYAVLRSAEMPVFVVK